MKKYIIFLFALLIVGSSIDAQVMTPSRWKGFQLDFRLAKSFDEKEVKYDGSPYLFDEFTESEIIMTRDSYEGIEMNYNIYDDEFEFRRNDTIYALANSQSIQCIIVDGRKFYYRLYEYNLLKGDGFLELLSEGRYNIWKKYNVSYTDPEPAGAYSDAKLGFFMPAKAEYFIEIDGGTIIRFSSLKEISSIMSDESINDYIKSNKLKMRKEEDIITLASYINSR